MNFERICIVRKLNASNSVAVNSVVTDIEAWANTQDCDIILPEDNQADEKTLFVAIGGDGTVIHAAKLALEHGAPALGFNLGKVGFLADFETKNVMATLHAAFEGQLEEDSRMVIAVKDNDGNQVLALNDFVLSCMYSDTTFSYDLFAGQKYAGSHSANGVIVSTPTGSTAYALSVGGAIIMPTGADILQVLPIAAQTLTSRPLIVPADLGVSIKFPYTKDRPVTLKADGQSVMTFTTEDDETHFASIAIEPIYKTVKLLHHNSWNHFDVLNKKLNWNK
jgi:NAD+ kinase